MHRTLILIALAFISCNPNKQASNILTSDNEVESGKFSCDSVAVDYFNKVQFPLSQLDTLDATNVDPSRFLSYDSCDNLLFANNRSDIQLYRISLFKTMNYYCPLIYRQMDMENCVFIYSFDENLNLLDAEILFCLGELERKTESMIAGKRIRFLNEERKAIFVDNKYISLQREYYSLRDSLTNNEVTEVGRQTVIQYELDGTGIFKITQKDTFEKPYTNINYWVE